MKKSSCFGSKRVWPRCLPAKEGVLNKSCRQDDCQEVGSLQSFLADERELEPPSRNTIQTIPDLITGSTKKSPYCPWKGEIQVQVAERRGSFFMPGPNEPGCPLRNPCSPKNRPNSGKMSFISHMAQTNFQVLGYKIPPYLHLSSLFPQQGSGHRDVCNLNKHNRFHFEALVRGANEGQFRQNWNSRPGGGPVWHGLCLNWGQATGWILPGGSGQ